MVRISLVLKKLPPELDLDLWCHEYELISPQVCTWRPFVINLRCCLLWIVVTVNMVVMVNTLLFYMTRWWWSYKRPFTLVLRNIVAFCLLICRQVSMRSRTYAGELGELFRVLFGSATEGWLTYHPHCSTLRADVHLSKIQFDGIVRLSLGSQPCVPFFFWQHEGHKQT